MALEQWRQVKATYVMPREANHAAVLRSPNPILYIDVERQEWLQRGSIVHIGRRPSRFQ